MVACSTAILLAGAAILHLSAAADHENLPVMMAGFIAVAVCQAALAGILVWRRPGGLVLVGALALTAGALGTWLVSRTLGLPFLPGGHMEPIGFKDGVTVLFEIGTIPGLLLLGSRELGSVNLPSPRLGNQAIAGLGAAAFALFVPAFVLGGGEHHSSAQHAAMEGHAHDEDAGDDGHAHADGEQLASVDSNDHAQGGGDHEHGDGGGAAGLLSASGAGSGHGGHEDGGADSGNLDGASLGGALGTGGHDGHGGGDHGDNGAGGGGEHGTRGHERGGHRDGGHGQGGHEGGGGHEEGGHGGGGHAPGTEHGGEHGHGAQNPEEGDGGLPGFDDPGSMTWGEHRFDYEPAREGQNGEVGSGYALVYRGPSDSSTGTVGHHSDEPCNPTPEQQAAADNVYRATWSAVRQYDNNPGKALRDGFSYMFPLTDRIIHMVAPSRVQNETILDPAQIESFLYVMTDDGLTAIAGMYVMPRFGMAGPQFGGCLTRWHEHAGLAGRLTTAGTQDRTPEMLHVWTYPGLDPWAHYDGRSLGQFWTPGKNVPSLCRQSGDASDVCLP